MRAVLLLPLALLLAACASTPATVSVLPACPAAPNCATRLLAVDDAAAAWATLADVLADRERLTITARDARELRATERTATLGFTDDLLFVRTDAGIAMRSVSRVGLWDFGTNARRLGAIAAAVRERLDG